MSDLNSSVRNEQISDTHGVTDNTDPLAPLAENLPNLTQLKILLNLTSRYC